MAHVGNESAFSLIPELPAFSLATAIFDVRDCTRFSKVSKRGL